MALSNELISQFVKATNDREPKKAETTVNGTAVTYDGRQYVRLDGSDLLTPANKTVDVKDDDRVTVLIKDHTATINGNMSSPAARTDDVKELGDKIAEFDVVIADKVSTDQLAAVNANIDELYAEHVVIQGELDAYEGRFVNLETDNLEINEKLTANEADIKKLDTEKLSAEAADLKYASVDDLEATDAFIHNLNGAYAAFADTTTKQLTAVDADIKNLETEKLSAEQAELLYANIDFSNIEMAAIEEFLSKSGIIDDLVVGEGTVTGKLVGVTITGDLIEGNTVKADKLVVKGEDGLYYKLNIEGGATTSEEVSKADLQNGLSGSIIVAKTITAEKIAVDDLVAFDATIGGFNITDSAIYSGVKMSATNTTRGIYLDKTGQFAVGDSNNYLRYYKDGDVYKLEISAGSIRMSTSNKTVEEEIEDLKQSSGNIQVGAVNILNGSKSLTGASFSVVKIPRTLLDENDEVLLDEDDVVLTE